MRRREFYWSLYNQREDKQIDNLRTDQVEAIWMAVSTAQRTDWIIWKEGFKEWKPFSEFAQMLKDLRHAPDEVKIVPPSPKQASALTTVESNFFNESQNSLGTGTLTMNSEYTSDARSNARYIHQYQAIICHAGQTFETLTVDLSMDGIKLKEDLPAWVPKYFIIEIKKGVSEIRLTCSRLKSEHGLSANTLKIESNDFQATLKSWLIDSGHQVA